VYNLPEKGGFMAFIKKKGMEDKKYMKIRSNEAWLIYEFFVF